MFRKQLRLNKPLIATFATIFLLTTSCTAVASPSIKHNASCSTRNQIVLVKNITYKCAPVNKKLVWRAVAKELAQTNTNSSSPSNTDTAITRSIADSFNAWAEKNTKENTRHVVIINSDVPTKSFAILNPTEIRASKIFSSIVTETTYSFMSIDDAWFFDKGIQYNQIFPHEGRAVCFDKQSVVAACTNTRNGIFYNLLDSELRDSDTHRALGAHEYFHLVQGKLGNLKLLTSGEIPTWFSEGSAVFVGYAVLALESGRRYEDIAANLPFSKDLQNDPYSAGRVAIEYLVKTYGFEKILDLYKDYSSNSNFDQVFVKNFGITVKDLQSKL